MWRHLPFLELGADASITTQRPSAFVTLLRRQSAGNPVDVAVLIGDANDVQNSVVCFD